MHRQLYIARREKNLKQKEVAEILHINSTTYYRKEKGVSEFTLSEALTLAALFEMTVEELFGSSVVKEENRVQVNTQYISQDIQEEIMDLIVKATLPKVFDEIQRSMERKG